VLKIWGISLFFLFILVVYDVFDYLMTIVRMPKGVYAAHCRLQRIIAKANHEMLLEEEEKILIDANIMNLINMTFYSAEGRVTRIYYYLSEYARICFDCGYYPTSESISAKPIEFSLHLAQ
jgi:hypothetical protein